MSEPKDKRKFALWVTEETMQKVEKLYREENVKSRSEFIILYTLFFTNIIKYVIL